MALLINVTHVTCVTFKEDVDNFIKRRIVKALTSADFDEDHMKFLFTLAKEFENPWLTAVIGLFYLNDKCDDTSNAYLLLCSCEAEEFYLTIIKPAFFPYKLTFHGISEISGDIKKRALACTKHIYVHVIKKQFNNVGAKNKYLLNGEYLTPGEKQAVNTDVAYIPESGVGKDIETVIEPKDEKPQIHVVIDLELAKNYMSGSPLLSEMILTGTCKPDRIDQFYLGCVVSITAYNFYSLHDHNMNALLKTHVDNIRALATNHNAINRTTMEATIGKLIGLSGPRVDHSNGLIGQFCYKKGAQKFLSAKANAKFSLLNPTVQEIADAEGDSGVLLGIQENNMKKSRGTLVGRNGGKSHKCLNVNKPKLLPTYQAYSKLYGKTKIFPKYEALQNEDSTSLLDMAVLKKSMEVDMYCRQKKAGTDQNDGDIRSRNENYGSYVYSFMTPLCVLIHIRRAIGVLQNTLPSIAESLSAQTDWQVSIFVGGPNPQFPDGECSILDYHVGKTLQGKDFTGFLGDKHAELKESFTQFIHHSYECKSHVLLSVANDFLEESDSEDDSEIEDKDVDSSNDCDVPSSNDKESSPKDVPPGSDKGSSSKDLQSDKNEKFRAEGLDEGNHIKKKKAVIRRPKAKPIDPIVPSFLVAESLASPISASPAISKPPASPNVAGSPVSPAIAKSLGSPDVEPLFRWQPKIEPSSLTLLKTWVAFEVHTPSSSLKLIMIKRPNQLRAGSREQNLQHTFGSG
ncbi:hypothetical protein BDQ17DRAFT_1439443 [Cyathus striatus]|nr:hypothetical protein BDQ17DRAFT_1439443 [Cyathus striatus]